MDFYEGVDAYLKALNGSWIVLNYIGDNPGRGTCHCSVVSDGSQEKMGRKGTVFTTVKQSLSELAKVKYNEIPPKDSLDYWIEQNHQILIRPSDKGVEMIAENLDDIRIVSTRASSFKEAYETLETKIAANKDNLSDLAKGK